MGSREDLSILLNAIPGVQKAYFQPPSNAEMVYPCIVYNLDRELTRHANNQVYKRDKGYLVTVIDRNPDSAIPDLIGSLPKTRFVRHFTADKLHHFVYTIFF